MGLIARSDLAGGAHSPDLAGAHRLTWQAGLTDLTVGPTVDLTGGSNGLAAGSHGRPDGRVNDLTAGSRCQSDGDGRGGKMILIPRTAWRSNPGPPGLNGVP
jgi:hypothetical protein